MTTSTPAADVALLELHGPVALLTLNRPHRRNALSQDLIDALRTHSAHLAKDPDVDVVVVTGAGGSFCSGLDLTELGAGRIRVDGDMIDTVRTMPQTTIAAISGPAVTGGLELALACDIRLADPSAVFADTHVRVGIPPGAGGSVLLPRLIGPGRAKEMSLSGRFVDAAEAERFGLVNRVTDDVRGAALELAGEVARNGPFTRTLKALIDGGANRGLQEALEHERRNGIEHMEQFDVAAMRDRGRDVITRGRTEVGS